jgi:RNA polymerase sigma-70 factor, ECF subfamily
MATGNENFTDEQLISGIRLGNHDVFTWLYSDLFQKLSWASLRYVRDASISEEIVQDVFLRIWEHPEEIASVKILKPYLYRMVINQSINYLNRQKNIEQHHLRIADELNDEYIENLIEDFALKELLIKEIDRLPEQCRKVFQLSRIENLKYREIAEQLNIAEKTVENHIVNALRILRLRLVHENHTVRKLPNGPKKMMMLLLSTPL